MTGNAGLALGFGEVGVLKNKSSDLGGGGFGEGGNDWPEPEEEENGSGAGHGREIEDFKEPSIQKLLARRLEVAATGPA